jgi:uncharacterized damage-inducible protein DinB
MNTQLNRVDTCLKKLSEEDIWKKVKSNTNSIGNLCIHLSGNEYQHFVSGIGKQPFIRERSQEFSAINILGKEELINHLQLVREKSAAVLLMLDEQPLIDIYRSE